jgi:signal transduction histidine kinase
VFGTLAVIGLSIPSQIRSDFASATQSSTALNVLTDTSGIGQIKEAISEVAIKYGIEQSELMTTIKCESSFNALAVGDHGLAYGLAQFHESTFDRYCSGDYHSPKDQLVCMAQMWLNHGQSNWSCWKHYFLN